MVPLTRCLIVRFHDGAEMSVPIYAISGLEDASWEDLNRWHFTGNRTGIRWGKLGIEISVDWMMREFGNDPFPPISW